MSGLRHVAVIMDGNGRWASARNLPRSAGHREGLTAARAVMRAAVKQGVSHLTLFAFSNENWRRPQTEVRALLSLFAETARDIGGELVTNGVRVSFIGERERFPQTLRAAMSSLEKMTENGHRLRTTVAVSYSGKWDVSQAAARAAANREELNENNIAKYLSTHDLPPVDLLIRTGGEHRLSNFLLWQAAYAELYFTPTLWPDFGEDDFAAAAADFARRERRFGGLKEA